MNICVYGAASKKIDASFTAAGETLGKSLATAGHGLVFGIWNEEIDSLPDDLKNGILFNGNRYDAMELCARIHPLTAQVLGTYEKDFYAGEAALTKNKFGKGEAYYIAARTDSDILSTLYDEMVETLHIEKALDCTLPQGVTAHIRHGENENIIFVENYTETEKAVDLPKNYKLFGTDQMTNSIKLAPFGIALLADVPKV